MTARKTRGDRAASKRQKRMLPVQFPPAVRGLSHVMMRIYELSLSEEEAAIEAARTGQAEWLSSLLPRLRWKMDTLAPRLLEVSAAFGNCDAIKTTYCSWETHSWNLKSYYYVQSCGALRNAIDRGDLNVIQCLLDWDTWDMTRALDQALKVNRQDVVELLCEESGDTEFLWAANEGHLQILERLHMSVPESIAYEAFAKAAADGNGEVVKFLLEQHRGDMFDAYLQERIESDGIAIEHAGRSGHLDIVKFLFENDGFAQGHELEALKAAAESGHTDIMKYLLDHGVTQESALNGAYVKAAGGGRLDSMMYLLATGKVRPSASDNAVPLSAEGGHFGVLKFLLHRGVSRSAVDEAFLKASASGHMEIVSFLYAEEGRTQPSLLRSALVEAAANGHLEIAKFLINTGTTRGLSIMRCSSHVNLFNLYLFVTFSQENLNGADERSHLNDAFIRAASNGHTEVLQYVFSLGAQDPALFDEALPKAACRGHLEVVKFLCLNGGKRSDASMRKAMKSSKSSHIKAVFIFLKSRRF